MFFFAVNLPPRMVRSCKDIKDFRFGMDDFIIFPITSYEYSESIRVPRASWAGKMTQFWKQETTTLSPPLKLISIQISTAATVVSCMTKQFFLTSSDLQDWIQIQRKHRWRVSLWKSSSSFMANQGSSHWFWGSADFFGSTWTRFIQQPKNHSHPKWILKWLPLMTHARALARKIAERPYLHPGSSCGPPACASGSPILREHVSRPTRFPHPSSWLESHPTRKTIYRAAERHF